MANNNDGNESRNDVQRARQRYSAEEKCRLFDEPVKPRGSASTVARRYNVAPSLLIFGSRAPGVLKPGRASALSRPGRVWRHLRATGPKICAAGIEASAGAGRFAAGGASLRDECAHTRAWPADPVRSVRRSRPREARGRIGVGSPSDGACCSAHCYGARTPRTARHHRGRRRVNLERSAPGYAP